MISSALPESRISKISDSNGIRVFKIKSDKFNTNTINICIHDQLIKERASFNAILPSVLMRGCVTFPTSQDIFMELENLYGAFFEYGTIKKGERQIIQFHIEYISDKYVNDKINLTEKSFDFLYEIILKPLLEHKVFRNEYVEQEKNHLAKKIRSRINNKNQYAISKCFEEMCNGEPFYIYEKGSIEDLHNIDSDNLYKYYCSLIEHAPIDVYLCGEFKDDKIKYILSKLSRIKRGSKLNRIEPPIIKKEIKKVKEINEFINIEQAKLSLGFRTNIPPNDDSYYELLLYNSILTGGTHSKLFKNVREKTGLAYYVMSRLEKFKGLMVISCGIDSSNKEKTFDIIIKQMEDMKKGNISDYEYESALKWIETGTNSLKDSQLNIVDFYISQSIAGTEDSFDSVIEKIRKVKKEDLVTLSKSIKLDTVFFLTSKANQL